MIEEILETTKITKKIRNMSVRIKWMTYMLDGENNKLYSRKGINRIATQFYKNYMSKVGWRKAR